MVFACGKRNAHAYVTAEKENHAALDVTCVFSREVAFLWDFAGNIKRAEEECGVSCDYRDGRPFENAEQVEGVRDEHDREWNG